MDESTLHTEGKRSAITGGAISESVLNSSPTILKRSRSGSLVGLQQHFTPLEAAALATSVHGSYAITLDPTAGNGAFLARVPRDRRVAIEIDPDQLRAGEYSRNHPQLALCADLQQAAPLMRRAGVRVPRIHANPPFGLDWIAGDGSRVSSTVGTWIICQHLLVDDGLGAFITGRDRFFKEVMPREDAAGVYAIIDVPDLFEGVGLPIVLAFFTTATNRIDGQPALRLSLRRDQLVDAGPRIRELHDTHLRKVASPYSVSDVEIARSMEAVRLELGRAKRSQTSQYDVFAAGGRLAVRPSPITRLNLAKGGEANRLMRLDRQSISYFALNPKDWTFVADLASRGELTIAPDLPGLVADAQNAAALTTCPMYEVKPQQRLGFLDDLDEIRCIASDPERGYEAGERYAIATSSKVDIRRYEKATTSNRGEVSVRKFLEEAKILHVTIGAHTFDESADDVAYMIEHFDIPDPGDLATRFPERIEEANRVLDTLQEGREWRFKDFQRADLARMLVKGRGLLAWEQGLGKSLGGLSLALASVQRGCAERALIIAPQDLVPQWQKEAEFFYGIELEHIRTLADAHRVRRHLRAGGTGFYITHFEALSQVGSRDEALAHVTFKRSNTEEGDRILLDSKEFCPSCEGSINEGWQASPNVCGRCGYVHKRLTIKPASNVLAGAFRDGVIVIDEGTLFKGDTSKRSKAIRGMRASHRYVLTGTPISNFVNDAFWLLWWALGDASTAFPYAYDGGRAKFEEDFCVIEYMMGKAEEGKDNRRERRKVLPQVTNVSRLWRLLTGSMVRRRKEDTGEPIVARVMKPIDVPLGTAQAQLYKHWLSSATFDRFFRWKYPNHPLVEADLVERFAAGIGQLQKLEYATTIPESDPDRDWPGQLPIELSNFTPKNMKVIELAIKHAEAGEKVLIGSCLIDTGLWIAERLREYGINAVHITEENATGKAQTMSPRKRAKVMHEFRYGNAQVLCCGIPSIRLGHNLDTASCVIINGLVYSYEMFDQFIARAHRLTSKKDVTVYVPRVAPTSMDTAKWDLLTKKGAAADLALDGALATERHDPVSMDKVLRDLKAAGARIGAENTIDEASLEAGWLAQIAERAPAPEPVAVAPAPAPVIALPPRGPITVAPMDDAPQLSLFG